MSQAHALCCPYCSEPKYTFSSYCSHLEIFHEFQDKFVVTCHFPGCNKKFNKVTRLRKHDSRNHSSKFFFESLANTEASMSICESSETEGQICCGNLLNNESPVHQQPGNSETVTQEQMQEE